MTQGSCAPFSVVIPAYNRRALLDRTLQSVWAQTSRPAEIIVVDGASDDGTGEYLNSIRDRISVVRTERLPPGAARNAGAAIATADYLAFLDSDDLWFPWTLATFAEVVRSYRTPAYISGSFRQFTAESELESDQQAALEAESHEHYFSTWPQQLVIGAGMIAVRRDVFAAAGGFSSAEINLEDHDLSLKVGLAPGFVQIKRPLTLGWRQHSGGVTRILARGASGCDFLIAAERKNSYPGGASWAQVRKDIITTHTRSCSIENANAGHISTAWHIYLETFRWHWSLGRLKYLLMLPLLLLTRIVWRRPA